MDCSPTPTPAAYLHSPRSRAAPRSATQALPVPWRALRPPFIETIPGGARQGWPVPIRPGCERSGGGPDGAPHARMHVRSHYRRGANGTQKNTSRRTGRGAGGAPVPLAKASSTQFSRLASTPSPLNAPARKACRFGLPTSLFSPSEQNFIYVSKEKTTTKMSFTKRNFVIVFCFFKKI